MSSGSSAEDKKIEITNEEASDAEKEEETEVMPSDYSAWSTLKKVYAFNRLEFFLACLFSILNGCTFPGFAVGFRYGVEWLGDIETRNQYPDDTDKGEMPGTAWNIFILFFIIGCLTGIFGFLQMSFFHRFGTSISCYMRRSYFQSIMRQDITFHDKKSSSTLNATLASDSQLVNVGLGSQFGLTMQHLGEFIAGFGYALYLSPVVVGVMMALMPILLFVGWIQGKIASSSTSADEDEYAHSMGESGETLAGLRTVMSLNAEAKKFNTFSTKVRKVEEEKRAYGWTIGIGIGMFLFGTFGGVYAPTLCFGAYRVDQGKLSSGEVFGAFFAVLIAGMAVGQTGASWPDVDKGLKAAYRMFKIIERKPERREPSGTPVANGIVGEIEFKNLKFAYPMRDDVDVYECLDLHIPVGQTVAFCGPTGCGKSTIVNLLERFYDPTGGEILIDGVAIHEYDLNYLRKQISLVSQEPVLFNDTIKNNILLGTERKDVPMGEVIEAAERANAHDFISNFPAKYETGVGEKGNQMSGGQKQRIAIARAIMKKSKIILLDEATSALDTKSEKVVQSALDKLIEDEKCTCIVIAHRLSTIRNADRIIVLDQGKIVEQGTHDYLMDLNGTYATMVDAQDVLLQQHPDLAPALMMAKMSSMSNTSDADDLPSVMI